MTGGVQVNPARCARLSLLTALALFALLMFWTPAARADDTGGAPPDDMSQSFTPDEPITADQPQDLQLDPSLAEAPLPDQETLVAETPVADADPLPPPDAAPIPDLAPAPPPEQPASDQTTVTATPEGAATGQADTPPPGLLDGRTVGVKVPLPVTVPAAVTGEVGVNTKTHYVTVTGGVCYPCGLDWYSSGAPNASVAGVTAKAAVTEGVDTPLVTLEAGASGQVSVTSGGDVTASAAVTGKAVVPPGVMAFASASTAGPPTFEVTDTKNKPWTADGSKIGTRGSLGVTLTIPYGGLAAVGDGLRPPGFGNDTATQMGLAPPGGS